MKMLVCIYHILECGNTLHEISEKASFPLKLLPVPQWNRCVSADLKKLFKSSSSNGHLQSFNNNKNIL